MKSVAQLAQSAYDAYWKKAVQIDEEGLAGHAPAWADLDAGTHQCWTAVATQLWAECSAIQLGAPVSDSPEAQPDASLGLSYTHAGKTYKTVTAFDCLTCAFFCRHGGEHDACTHPDQALVKRLCGRDNRPKGVNVAWVVS